MILFVAGGAGFIGANFAHLATELGHKVFVYDALTYAGKRENLDGIPESHLEFVQGDIRDGKKLSQIFRNGFRSEPFDAVINFAAESHVDRSISEALPFVESNVLGTVVLLEAARNSGVPRFIQISTDEVYGSIEGGSFTRNSPLKPSSAYSASKAAADHLVMSFHHTHGYDVRITRCTNNYGPYQHSEKFIPAIIAASLEGRPVPIFGNGTQVRDWIFVRDHCEGILAVLTNGKAGGLYHFGALSDAGREWNNLELVQRIGQLLHERTGKGVAVQHVADRLGHDQRYALDWSDSQTELGWRPKTPLEQGLKQTIDWYLATSDSSAK